MVRRWWDSVLKKIFPLIFVAVLTNVGLAQDSSRTALTEKPKEETCVISGLVLRKQDSTPLKDAVVQLEYGDDPRRTITTKTSADGLFELRDFPAGQYWIKVSRKGYFTQAYGQREPGDPGARVALRPGQELKDLIFRMGRAGVITGRVFNEDGEPLEGAMITGLHQVYRDGQKRLTVVQVDRSNDLGEYRLFGLAPGRYFVSAELRTWNRTVEDNKDTNPGKTGGENGYTKVYFPNAFEPRNALSITVKEGDKIPSIDIQMREVVVYRIRGKIVNLVSSPGSRETQVELIGRNSQLEWNIVKSQSMSKDDGSFEIPEIVPGEYTAVAFSYDEGNVYSTQEDVDVGNADIEGLTLTIGPGINVPGKIIWEGKPSVQREGLTVAAGATQVGLPWGGQTRVDENQQFTLKRVPQGIFQLEVNGISKECYVKEVKSGDVVLSDTSFRVTKGSAGPLEIMLSSRGARIEGIVTNEDNLPVAGVWVVAVPAKGKQHRLFKSITTDQYGRFDLHGLAPGQYTLFSWNAAERDAWEDEDFLKEFKGKGTTLEVQDGDTQSLALKLIQVNEAGTKSE